MRAKYYLTFEFEEACPISVRGEVEASGVRKLVWRAVDDAVNKNPNVKWQSLVVVLDKKDLEQG